MRAVAGMSRACRQQRCPPPACLPGRLLASSGGRRPTAAACRGRLTMWAPTSWRSATPRAPSPKNFTAGQGGARRRFAFPHQQRCKACHAPAHLPAHPPAPSPLPPCARSADIRIGDGTDPVPAPPAPSPPPPRPQPPPPAAGAACNAATAAAFCATKPPTDAYYANQASGCTCFFRCASGGRPPTWGTCTLPQRFSNAAQACRTGVGPLCG